MYETTIIPAAIGVELRHGVTMYPDDAYASAIRRINQLDVQLVRRDDRWTLYLADLTPVPHTTRDRWAAAVGAPSVEWHQTPDGCSAWCAWTEPVRR